MTGGYRWSFSVNNRLFFLIHNVAYYLQIMGDFEPLVIGVYMQSKPTIETILTHRSIRKFTDQPISPEIFELLIKAGQQASTSNHLQCVSIIRITDPSLRQQFYQITQMQYVNESAEFLVFCCDFHKHKMLVPEAQLDWAEVGLIGAVDAGIMAQNVLLAAESLGLGGVYIGALRNDIEQAAQLLKLPANCLPLFGLCLGYPAQDPMLKPRLSTSLICHQNHYQEMDNAALAEYNAKLEDYYQQREGKPLQWQTAITKTLAKPVRPHILPFL